MPPKKSRRLPGGKVRRPAGRPGQARPEQPAGTPPAAQPPDGTALTAHPGPPAAEPAPPAAEPVRGPRPPAAGRQPAPIRPGPALPAETAAARRARERTARQRVAGQRAPAQRTGPSMIDLAAQNYRHIRGDLVRIAILAAAMVAVIIALSFVIK
jgi:hypothetical protein